MAARRKQQRKRDEKRAARDRQAAFDDEQGRYEPPSRDTCEERPYRFQGYEHDNLDYVARTWRQAGRLADFQITVRYRASGHWVNVVEIDCQHGHVHYHTTLPGQPRCEGVHIHTLDTQADLREGLKKATEAVAYLVMQVLDEWQEVEP